MKKLVMFLSMVFVSSAAFGGDKGDVGNTGGWDFDDFQKAASLNQSLVVEAVRSNFVDEKCQSGELATQLAGIMNLRNADLEYVHSNVLNALEKECLSEGYRVLQVRLSSLVQSMVE